MPAAIGFLVMSVYQMIDVWFVSRYAEGEIAIAAITVVLPITFLISSFGMAIGIGGASVLSRALGEGNNEKAQKTFGNQVTLTLLLVGIFVVIGYLFQDKFLMLFGANEQILPYAKKYFNILLLGLPFLGWAMMSNNVIRAEGKPKMAMFTLIIPAFSNIILDYVFIYKMDMGIEGAAWATSIGYILSGVYTLWFLLSGKSELSLTKSTLRIDKLISKEIASIGSITLVRQSMFSLLAIVLYSQLNKWGQVEYADTLGAAGGSHSIAIYGLIRGYTLFIAFPIIGIMQGLMPIISYNYGAKNWDRVKDSVWLAIKWTTLISLVLLSVIVIFPEQLIGIFTEDKDLLAHTPRVLRLIFISLPIMGVGFIGGGYFQAVGKPIPALVLTLARQGLFMIPLMYILARIIGLDGVWAAIPIGEIFAGIWSAIWLFQEVNKKREALE
ncbi:MATE family efflux transporter [Bacteroidia bacterium]|nr:MATE family efflux transporter [Bacteroidia bacterium]MDB9883185.1 MATE family efflux transporter [Bacteroidia bacterium]